MAQHHLFIDLETYSDEDIKKVGLYKYAQSPAFEVLLLSYSWDGQPVQTLDFTVYDNHPGDGFPEWLHKALISPDVIKHAYNAAFEWYCFTRWFRWTPQQAIKYLPQWRCSMLHAMYAGYPGTLAAAGAALGLPEDKQKMAVGQSLIRYFCKPCKPTKVNGGRKRNLPRHDPAKWELFRRYNAQDVVTEMAVDGKLARFPVPEDVQRQWALDQVINLRGVAVDLSLANGAIELGEQVRDALIREAKELTGLQNPNSVKQLVTWLDTELEDEEVDNLRKETVTDLLGRELPSAAASRVLEIRRELGKASIKKYDAIETCMCADGRVRGLLQFYGANRTGREAGRLVQVQNLPHDTVPGMASARELVRRRDIDSVRMLYGSVTSTLSALIRTTFIAAPGMKFVDADFSAIEARVIAWLAGEDWVLDVFRTHGKIYEATAAQMFGIPVEKIRKGNPEYSYRAKGKVATLALGYQGGAGALINMGALRSGLTEAELPDIVTRWRSSNPAIVYYWYAVEEAAKAAVTSGAVTDVGRVRFAYEADEQSGLAFLAIRLPSGRKLYYAAPHMGVNRFGKPSLCYWGQNQSSKKWQVLETYGGKLAENITQAVARDCLFFAMENLEAAGWRIVFDVHDEVVIEAPADRADLDAVVRIMSQPPPWAADLPLNADGWVDGYFKKD